MAVRNLGRNFIHEVEADRAKNGPYTTFYDFCSRMHGRDLNRRALESLIKCGALDGLDGNRRQMLMASESILDGIEADRKKNLEGQLGLFDLVEDDSPTASQPVLPAVGDLTVGEKLSMEKETTGLYLSGHPMAQYAAVAEQIKAARIGEILEQAAEPAGGGYRDGSRVTLLVLIQSMKLKTTKSNTTMAFLTAEDRYGSIEVIVFPKTLTEYMPLLQEGQVVLLKGRVSAREDEEAKIVCESVEPAPAADGSAPPTAAGSSGRNGLYLKIGSQNGKAFERVMQITSIFEGTTPLYLHFTDTKKTMLAPRISWVTVNEPMLGELRRILGETCVKLKE